MRYRIGFYFALLLTLALAQSIPAHAARTSLPTGFARVEHANGLKQPTAFAFQGKQIFVTEKEGKVKIITAKGKLRAKAYLKLKVTSDKERGVLGIAVEPNYSENKFVYVYYTTGQGAKAYSGAPLNRVSRFTTKDGVGTKEKILLDNIPSDTGYHNGGDLHFGFDGKLYITIGDGGLYWGAARELDVVRGKILRINSDGSVPTDNPFFNMANIEPRIFAYGFRNPFRLALREANQTYIAGDVGLDTWEELDWVQAGFDYGWHWYEGPCLSDELLTCDPTQTDFQMTTPPFHYYNHSTGDEIGSTIIAGAFPKNSNYPAPYNDALFYGDFSFGWVHALALDNANQVTARNDFDELNTPVSFAVGPNGNIYVLSYIDGAIYKYIYTP